MRTYGLARALALRGGLTLLYARFGADEPDTAFREIAGIELDPQSIDTGDHIVGKEVEVNIDLLKKREPGTGEEHSNLISALH